MTRTAEIRSDTEHIYTTGLNRWRTSVNSGSVWKVVRSLEYSSLGSIVVATVKTQIAVRALEHQCSYFTSDL